MPAVATAGAGLKGMLGRRVVTAVVLLVVLLVTLRHFPRGFVAVTAALAAVGAYEWWRLAGWPPARAAAGAGVLGLALVASAVPFGAAGGPVAVDAAFALPAAIVAAVAWLGLAAVVVNAERTGARLPAALSAALCPVLLAAAWGSAMLLLARSGWMLLSAMAVVWASDIAAYFFGRAFGQRKLAPRISPGKTWAGVWGALGTVALLAVGTRLAWPDPRIFTNLLFDRVPIALALAILVLMVTLAVVGDLFESLLKRQAGAKDSGWLLPGHGGVLDRIDALLPALPLAAIVAGWAT